MAERFPEELDMWTAGQDIRRGGETLTEAGTRVARVIADALLGEGLLIVVGHGMSLRAALEMLAEQRLVNLGGPAPHLGNGCHVVAEITEHATTVVSRPSV